MMNFHFPVPQTVCAASKDSKQVKLTEWAYALFLLTIMSLYTIMVLLVNCKYNKGPPRPITEEQQCHSVIIPSSKSSLIAHGLLGASYRVIMAETKIFILLLLFIYCLKF